MKKITALLLAVFILASFFQTLSFAAGKINIFYDNKPVEFSPLPATISGRTYVPIQPFFNKLGANLYYDASNRVYTVYFQGDYLKFQVSKGILNNLQHRQKDYGRIPQILRAMLYAPAFSHGILGHGIDWIGRDSKILIHSPKQFIPVINYGSYT